MISYLRIAVVETVLINHCIIAVIVSNVSPLHQQLVDSLSSGTDTKFAGKVELSRLIKFGAHEVVEEGNPLSINFNLLVEEFLNPVGGEMLSKVGEYSPQCSHVDILIQVHKIYIVGRLGRVRDFAVVHESDRCREEMQAPVSTLPPLVALVVLIAGG